MNLTDEQKKIIDNTINHKAFYFEKSNGKPFYSTKKKEVLYQAFSLLLSKLDEMTGPEPIYEKVQTLLSTGTFEFPCNFSKIYSSELNSETFPDERLQGRTAYGLLCTDDGSNCVGFAEASCILLNLKGYEASPLVAKLLKSNQVVCHYVTAVLGEDGEVHIIDPERLRSCNEPEKQWELLAYQSSIMYACPDEKFCQEKIGKKGLGPTFMEYMQNHEVAKPVETIKKEHPEILDEQGRLPMAKGSLSKEALSYLKSVISNNVYGMYKQSLLLGQQLEQQEELGRVVA